MEPVIEITMFYDKDMFGEDSTEGAFYTNDENETSMTLTWEQYVLLDKPGSIKTEVKKA